MATANTLLEPSHEVRDNSGSIGQPAATLENPPARIRRHRAVVVGAFVVSAGALWALLTADPNHDDLQRANLAEFMRLVAPGRSAARAGLYWDLLFTVAYGVLGVAAFELLRRSRPWSSLARTGARLGSVLVATAAVTDQIENALLLRMLRGQNRPSESDLSLMRSVGGAKLALGAAAVVSLIVVLLLRGRNKLVPAQDSPEPYPDPLEPRRGVCLSGGGIRSAAFSLGVVQALQTNNRFRNVDYLSAASGGAYFAAGWAVADAQSETSPSSPPVFSPASPEERWLRNNSSYLIPSLREGAGAMVRLVTGIVVNVLVLWLLIFAVARPIGWAMRAVHPELAANHPTLLSTGDNTGAMKVAQSATEIDSYVSFVDGARHEVKRFEVNLAQDEARIDDERYQLKREDNEIVFRQAPVEYKRILRDRVFAVGAAKPAVLEIDNGRAAIVRQPTVCVLRPGVNTCQATKAEERAKLCPAPPSGARIPWCNLSVSHQPELELTSDLVIDPAKPAALLAVKHQPRVKSASGLVGRGELEFDPWMWLASFGLLAGAVAVGIGVMLLRLHGGGRRVGIFVSVVCGLGGAGVFLTTIGLPWAAREVPLFFEKIVAGIPGVKGPGPAGAGLGDYLLPGGGFGLLAITAIRRYLAGNRGAEPGTIDQRSPSLLGRILRPLTTNREALSWYELTPAKILLGILLVIIPTVLFLGQLQYAAANGSNGVLMGVPLVRDAIPDTKWFVPDWWRWAAAAAVLVVFRFVADAHSWSLYSYYKRHLSHAFVLRRVVGSSPPPPGGAEPIPYEDLLPFSDDEAPFGCKDGKWRGLPLPGASDHKPSLVVCCSVNLSEVGVVPPGRRASSFTFDSRSIGGPLVGYVPTADYWRVLAHRRRRRDITIPSAMAISGAAFSPAMGKKNLGPVGSIFAVANLRLGIWLPNPKRVKAMTDGASTKLWGKLDRPGWTYFIREIANRYRLDGKYVYVSDGGHWENLGLVELLRRDCTEIVCVNAGGDHQDSFGTIAEAIALAREELGVEIVLDPKPLRPHIPLDTDPAPPAPPRRELRRQGAKDKAEPFAPASYAKGSFTYLLDPRFPQRVREVTGTIWLLEPAITNDLPFDAHGFAESEPIFPDDSTADQVYNHRQFESFRRLGQHQMEKLFDSEPALFS